MAQVCVRSFAFNTPHVNYSGILHPPPPPPAAPSPPAVAGAVGLPGLGAEAAGCKPPNSVMVAAGGGADGGAGAGSVLVAGLSVAFLPRSAAFWRASSWAALAAAS